MRQATLFARIHARLHSDERGFTLAEAMIASLILALGSFAVAQSLHFGLKTTGLARQRAAADALGNQQMELARTMNYGSVVLRDNPSDANDLPTHSDDPGNPNYWVTEDPVLAFDPDGDGPKLPEPIYAADTSPSLIHHETDVKQGNTTFTIYRYVTWVDSPADNDISGNDRNTNPDANNGAGDGNGHDLKRVTVIVMWPSVLGTSVSQFRMTSLFSDAGIRYHGTTVGGGGGDEENQPPSVLCPLWSHVGRTASFTAQATDSDGSVIQIDWDFGDGVRVANGGVVQTHTYSKQGTYKVVNTVWDDQGATATNASFDCMVTVTNTGAGGDDLTPPTGSILIAGGATYTNTAQVVLDLSATDNEGGSGVAQMQFSDDGTNFGAAITYSTTTLYTMPGADGTKTVYVRFIDVAGNVSSPYLDTIILDTIPPGQPTGVTATRGPVAGGKVDITVRWNAPSPPGDLAGFRIYRQSSTSSTWVQVGGNLPSTATSYLDRNLNASIAYTYCVVAFDPAGNESERACTGLV